MRYRQLLYRFANEHARTVCGDADDYIGTLLLRLNEALHLYDPTRGTAFTTYFYKRWYDYVWRHFARHEGESFNAAYVQHTRVAGGMVNATLVGTEYINDITLGDHDHAAWNHPAVARPFAEFFDRFDSDDDAWAYLTKSLSARQRLMIGWRYRDGLMLKAIGDRLSISKERAR